MNKKYYSADRSIVLTVSGQRIINVELRGKSSVERLSSQLCALHKKAFPTEGSDKPIVTRDETTLDMLKNPPIPAFAELFTSLHTSLEALYEAGETLQSQPMAGETDYVKVSLHSSGRLQKIEERRNTHKLSAQELAHEILAAYHNALSSGEMRSAEISQALVEKIEEACPVRVTST